MSLSFKKELAQAYDADAVRRSQSSMSDWKAEERDLFIERLRKNGGGSVLEIGAGTGRDSFYFQQCGL
ncbi:hypothetical protein [Paenibacillus sp. OAS669]|uniref:hypothetical protein n=1 Tax=Paenibacillus sp. OAS669 TaxID=2663821 RepID=UPI001A0400EA|nr:hypothetical protein [Paenibacillus sp. OAS669]MBE1441627.1 ubiquinone/menaquinone biosynthesis C-methylase UbiE [Paenibacillus sp. OAS669]